MVLNNRPKLKKIYIFLVIVFIAFGHVMGSYKPVKAMFE